MLSGRAAQYFKTRDQQGSLAAARRTFFQAMLSVTEGIVRMRTKRKLTQSELAKRLKTSQSTIGLWETPGYTGYSLKKLYALGAALGYRLHIEFVEESTRPDHLTLTFTEEAATGWHHKPGAEQGTSLAVLLNVELANRKNHTDQPASFEKEK